MHTAMVGHVFPQVGTGATVETYDFEGTISLVVEKARDGRLRLVLAGKDQVPDERFPNATKWVTRTVELMPWLMPTSIEKGWVRWMDGLDPADTNLAWVRVDGVQVWPDASIPSWGDADE